MLRRQAVAEADGAQVARGEGLAGGNVFDHVERAAEHSIALFAGLAAVVDAAARLPGDAAAAATLLPLLRLQREGGAPAAVAAAQGGVPFDAMSAGGAPGDTHHRPTTMDRKHP